MPNFNNLEEINLQDGKKRIQISKCHAFGRQFKNLIPGSIHELCNPPEGYKQGEKGYWVMGVGEPVLVLYGEFKVIES